MTKSKDLIYVFFSSMLFGVFNVANVFVMFLIAINSEVNFYLLLKNGALGLFHTIVLAILSMIIVERGEKLIIGEIPLAVKEKGNIIKIKCYEDEIEFLHNLMCRKTLTQGTLDLLYNRIEELEIKIGELKKQREHLEWESGLE